MKRQGFFQLSQEAVMKLAENFETPLLVLSLDQIEKNYCFLKAHLPNVRLHYAMRNIRICENSNEYIFIGKISDVETELSRQDFVRNHKSYVVNLKYVRNVYKDTIILENDEKLPLSKHRSKKLRERLFNYMKASK